MGNSESQEPPTPTKPKPKLHTDPWRTHQSTYETLVSDIEAVNTGCPANVLLLGPTGAGKSSIINSILSIVAKRRVNKAYTGSKDTSFTTTYDQYKDEGFMKNCCLWDSMGIEHVFGGGLLLDDLVYLLKGHVMKGYKFNPRARIQENDPCFRRKPKAKDRIHCVVFVLDSTIVNESGLGPFMPKIRVLQDGTKDLNIPAVMILTKIDSLCTEVKADINKTFRSIAVHKAVTMARDIFGISEGNIHPVKNYEQDIEINKGTSIFILLALRQILQYASDQIEAVMEDEKKGCIMF
ncbi:interferon-induced protein 44-like [Mercenaria mercenaria]|uniref:interferon-induced protein 44-like n=1 Tax=Mercenaria mercenaria TaxID=6596 RepID=UPI00234FA9EB|nr:interferon-induced protein 44-like [Mercenaria mercenaria]